MTTTPLRLGSMCSGYGGLDMAARAVLGGDLAWVADTDPGAARILARHHPDVPNLGDITVADWATVPPVDVLTAGFPCQDISNAGKRAGIGGKRSGIWTNVVAAVGLLRPRYAFFENVGALTVRGLDTVLGDLAEVGFDAEWASLRASDAGAPHRRERIFILAWPADAQGVGHGHTGAPGFGGFPAAAVTGDPAAGAWGPYAGAIARWERWFLIAWPSDADPTHLGHERAGGARVGRPGPADSGHVAAHPDSSGRPRLQQGPQGGDGHPQLRNDAERRGEGAWGRYEPSIRQWERVVGRVAPVPTESGRTGQPRLSPAFVEWLMGLPEGHVTAPEIGLSRNQQLKALGNGVVPQQGAHALRMLVERAASVEAA